jgi:hypothetical protein
MAYNPANPNQEQQDARYAAMGLGPRPTGPGSKKAYLDWAKQVRELDRYAAWEPSGEAYQKLWGKPRERLGGRYGFDPNRRNAFNKEAPFIQGRIGDYGQVGGYTPYNPMDPTSWRASSQSLQPAIQARMQFEKDRWEENKKKWATNPLVRMPGVGNRPTPSYYPIFNRNI